MVSEPILQFLSETIRSLIVMFNIIETLFAPSISTFLLSFSDKPSLLVVEYMEFFLVQAEYDLDELEDVAAHKYYHGLGLDYNIS